MPDYLNPLIPYEVTFTIPDITDKGLVGVFHETATAAEAEQQQLMTSPAFSKAILSNASFRDLMETYAAVQQSYHRAMAFHMERHAALAGSSAAVAYAMLCEVLGRDPSKQPGDCFTSVELQQLATDAARSPGCQANAAVLNLAEALIDHAMNTNDDSPRSLAMPSTVEQGTFVNNVTRFLGGTSPARRNITSFAASSVHSWTSSGPRVCMKAILLALAEKEASQMPDVGDGSPPYVMVFMGIINMASP